MRLQEEYENAITKLCLSCVEYSRLMYRALFYDIFIYCPLRSYLGYESRTFNPFKESRERTADFLLVKPVSRSSSDTNSSTAGISAGAHFRDSRFSLCSHISFECSLTVGVSDNNLHLTVIKLTINLSYS